MAPRRLANGSGAITVGSDGRVCPTERCAGARVLDRLADIHCGEIRPSPNHLTPTDSAAYYSFAMTSATTSTEETLPARYDTDPVVKYLWDQHKFTVSYSQVNGDPFAGVIYHRAQWRMATAARIRREIESTIKGCTDMLGFLDKKGKLFDPGHRVHDVTRLVTELDGLDAVITELVKAYREHEQHQKAAAEGSPA